MNRLRCSAEEYVGEEQVSEQTRLKRELRVYRQQLKSMASQLSLGEERSRRRIATELHDTIGQILATVKIRLSILKQGVSSPEALECVSEVIELCNRAIHCTRSLSFELSPLELYELGFAAALRSLVGKYRDNSAVEFELEDDGRPKALDDETGVLLFLALRELLDRIAMQVRVRTVKVSVSEGDGEIVVAVESDANGFGARMLDGGQAGLFAIRERLKYLGGSLEIEPVAGQGSRVVLSAPLEGRGRNQLELDF